MGHYFLGIQYCVVVALNVLISNFSFCLEKVNQVEEGNSGLEMDRISGIFYAVSDRISNSVLFISSDIRYPAGYFSRYLVSGRTSNSVSRLCRMSVLQSAQHQDRMFDQFDIRCSSTPDCLRGAGRDLERKLDQIYRCLSHTTAGKIYSTHICKYIYCQSA